MREDQKRAAAPKAGAPKKAKLELAPYGDQFQEKTILVTATAVS